jgi:hypothetical protein
MIANIIIITGARDPDILSKTLSFCSAHGLTLGYLLDPAGREQNAAALSFLLRSEKGNYCLALPSVPDEKNDQETELFSGIYGFLLGAHYLKVNTHPVIATFTPGGNGQLAAGLQRISEQLTALGLHEPLFPYPAIDEKDKGQVDEGALLFDPRDILGKISRDEIYAGYSSLLNKPNLADRFILLYNNDPLLINEFIEIFESAEASLQKNDPALAIMQQQYKTLKNGFSEAQNTIVALREDNLSYKKYLDFLKGSIYSPNSPPTDLNEQEKIKRFYHFEYEILPMWYKRFGHIMKVLMGKRTFRSLFNDTVKKYKD